MSFVAIVDYGMCNLDSIRRALEECGAQPRVTDDPADLEQAERIVLPGVGTFADAMRNLCERGLDRALREQARQQLPILGICLGMQLLASSGSEGGATPGLGLIPGEVTRLQPTPQDPRIPHVGWNEVRTQREHPLFKGIAPGKDFYFVHSYHFACTNSAHSLATTPYCGGFNSAVSNGSVMGVQFHPEKSQKTGFALLRNFLLC